MKKVLVFVCVLVMSVVAFGQKKKAADAGAMKASPYVGTWKLDPSSNNPNWKSATLTISRDTDKAIVMGMSGVNKDGKPFHNPASTAMKDKDSRLSNGSTMNYHSDHSFQIKEKDGSVDDLKMTLEDNDQTLKVDGTYTDKDGKKNDIHDVWKRAGGMKKSAAAKKAS